MSTFADDWLSAREPADRRARDSGLVVRLAELVADRPSVGIVDIGAGTGSTARAIAGLLPGRQHWDLVDFDADHLRQAATSLASLADRDGEPLTVRTLTADLSSGLPASLIEGADILTCSAFLDLVGQEFVERFAATAAEQGLVVYAALNVDGRLACDPADAMDAAIFAAFNAHMRGDKGFGPALGAASTDATAEAFRARGYVVATAPSDWVVDSGDNSLAARLLDGWVTAVSETGQIDAADLQTWEARRRDEISADGVRFLVGHMDLLAWPAQPQHRLLI